MTTETKTKKTVAEQTPVKDTAKQRSVVKINHDDFAVIETGGKQYVVSVGDVIDVELLGDLKEGDTVKFDKVLMSDNGKDATVGNPYIKGAKVTAKYLGLHKGKKISILRYKAKSNRSRKLGHRQKYSSVEIESLK